MGVGFEDLLGGGDKDFNDVYLLKYPIAPVTSQPQVPEFHAMALRQHHLSDLLVPCCLSRDPGTTNSFLFSFKNTLNVKTFISYFF